MSTLQTDRFAAHDTRTLEGRDQTAVEQQQQQQQSSEQPKPSASSIPASGQAGWVNQYEGQDIDEEVLNALPPELKHEVRLASLTRLKGGDTGRPRVTTGADSQTRSEQQRPVLAGQKRSVVQTGGVGPARKTVKQHAPISHFFSKQTAARKS